MSVSLHMKLMPISKLIDKGKLVDVKSAKRICGFDKWLKFAKLHRISKQAKLEVVGTLGQFLEKYPAIKIVLEERFASLFKNPRELEVADLAYFPGFDVWEKLKIIAPEMRGMSYGSPFIDPLAHNNRDPKSYAKAFIDIGVALRQNHNELILPAEFNKVKLTDTEMGGSLIPLSALKNINFGAFEKSINHVLCPYYPDEEQWCRTLTHEIIEGFKEAKLKGLDVFLTQG